MFDKQSQYFDEDSEKKKKYLKERIEQLRDELIIYKLRESGNNEILDKYNFIKKQKLKPYFIWELEFAKVYKEKGGFDIVIGNPPYVLLQDENRNDKLYNFFKIKYSVASYKIDLYHLFIERGINLLKDKGIISYITPSNFLSNKFSLNLRKYLLSNTVINQILIFDENVFNANVNNLVFVGTKKTIKDEKIIFLKAVSNKKSKLLIKLMIEQQQKMFMEDNFLLIPPQNVQNNTIIRKIEEGSIPLGSFATVNFGMQLRNRKKYTTDVIKGTEDLSSYHKPCYTGRDIKEYITIYDNLYCYFNKDEAKCGGCWDEEIHFKKNKLLVRQIGRHPIVSIDFNGYAVLNTAFMISVTKDNVNELFLLGILNSKLMKFYWENKYLDDRKQFPKIKGAYLKLLPMKFSKIFENLIIENVKIVIEKLNNDLDVDKELKEIDLLVFKLYSINDNYINIIEKYFKNN